MGPGAGRDWQGLRSCDGVPTDVRIYRSSHLFVDPPRAAARLRRDVGQSREGARGGARSARGPHKIDEGGGVFYAPEIAIKVKDAIGRALQGPTIPVDPNLPQRFDV